MIDIQKNVVLAPHTTFKIGGPAKEFVVVKNEEELLEALHYAKDNNLKYYILAGGSNVLFADEGFDGLVIRISGRGEIKLLEDQKIESWTGETLGQIVNFSKENSLAGMENLIGIPGSIGGAVRGNAGAFGTDTKDLVEKVRAVDISNSESIIREYSNAECDFAYRHSIFKENPKLIILSVTLKLKSGNKDEIFQRMKEIIKTRNDKLPMGWVGCAGSIFENPHVENAELHERFKAASGFIYPSGEIPAGWLISEMGLRGKKMGGIEVSKKHANFIINAGGGTANDVVMLTSFIKQQVRDNLGVQLKEEVNYIGY
ncbi:MAG: UDP-N-acetylmuramate dehydrogenase [Candidatus Moranbacteria bacterium]|nr:UDP-N-acetylmuramate dehydrogenase [Candidatus Moranbacteria bacterium]